MNHLTHLQKLNLRKLVKNRWLICNWIVVDTELITNFNCIFYLLQYTYILCYYVYILCILYNYYLSFVSPYNWHLPCLLVKLQCLKVNKKIKDAKNESDRRTELTLMIGIEFPTTVAGSTH